MILIIDCGSQKTPFIEQAIDLEMDYKTVSLFDVTEKDAENCIGIVISGAPILITEVDNSRFLDKLQWIKTIQIPVFGICFGHQIVGLMYGAFGSRQREDRDWQTIERLVDCPLLDKLPDTFEMMEDHCESISIPAGFELVATSDWCVNECMMHKEKPFFGVQFHPEVSGNLGTLLFENFVHICTEHQKKQT